MCALTPSTSTHHSNTQPYIVNTALHLRALPDQDGLLTTNTGGNACAAAHLGHGRPFSSGPVSPEDLFLIVESSMSHGTGSTDDEESDEKHRYSTVRPHEPEVLCMYTVFAARPKKHNGDASLNYLGQQKLQRLPSSTFAYHVQLVYHEARELVQFLRA